MQPVTETGLGENVSRPRAMADWAPSTTHDIKARLVRPPTRAPCNILNTSIAPYKHVPLHWKQTETNAVELQLSGFIGADPDDQI